MFRWSLAFVHWRSRARPCRRRQTSLMCSPRVRVRRSGVAACSDERRAAERSCGGGAGSAYGPSGGRGVRPRPLLELRAAAARPLRGGASGCHRRDPGPGAGGRAVVRAARPLGGASGAELPCVSLLVPLRACTGCMRSSSGDLSPYSLSLSLPRAAQGGQTKGPDVRQQSFYRARPRRSHYLGGHPWPTPLGWRPAPFHQHALMAAPLSQHPSCAIPNLVSSGDPLCGLRARFFALTRQPLDHTEVAPSMHSVHTSARLRGAADPACQLQKQHSLS